ncbi:hypothetical protein CRYUN_Cryun16bG0042400 [Craigia yunnanensis]
MRRVFITWCCTVSSVLCYWSLIEVKNGSIFLDLIVNQIQSLNSKYGCNVPLVLMNSSRTHDDILKVLEKYSSSKIDIQPFRQGEQTQQELSVREVRINGMSFFLCPLLDILEILNHLAQNNIEYWMEVTPTTSTGLMNFMAGSKQGKFKASDILNCPDLEDFTSNPTQSSAKKFKFIDTRNLWIDLKAIKRLVDTSALKLNDLSTLKSNLYTFAEGVLVRNDARTNPTNPSIDLGPEFEKISDCKSRFKTIPSIIRLDILEVTDDVWFGADITLKGRVITGAKPGVKLQIPDGVVLKDEGKFETDGTVVPVTVVDFREGNIVTQVKNSATDGYDAVQAGYKRVRDKKLTKPELGHLEKGGVIPMRHLQEFRLQTVEEFEVGHKLAVEEIFKVILLMSPGLLLGKDFKVRFCFFVFFSIAFGSLNNLKPRPCPHSAQAVCPSLLLLLAFISFAIRLLAAIRPASHLARPRPTTVHPCSCAPCSSTQPPLSAQASSLVRPSLLPRSPTPTAIRPKS